MYKTTTASASSIRRVTSTCLNQVSNDMTEICAECQNKYLKCYQGYTLSTLGHFRAVSWQDFFSNHSINKSKMEEVTMLSLNI